MLSQPKVGSRFTLDSRSGSIFLVRVNRTAVTHRRYPVSSPKEPVRINLTDDQKAQIRKTTGKDADAVELSVEELEERIAPFKTPSK